MDQTIQLTYNTWLDQVKDEELLQQLKSYSQTDIEDSFYKDLSFGTGGLRGVIGAGSNRVNIYTIAKASQGVANYIKQLSDNGKVAISYDSRIKSDVFAKVSASVFAANGIHVYIYDQLMPTPCLSYAVRALKCDIGIMVTASHNPSKYNGYKVYGSDGCQITTAMADAITQCINAVDIFNDVTSLDFNDGLNQGCIEYIDAKVTTDFINEVKHQSVLFGDDINKDVSIVYTPLNGTGLKPVLRTLNEQGFTNVSVVKEQELPDGNFPTCPYPNPEIKEAMQLGMEYASKVNADLLLATDPDCDRVGIAVKDTNGEYKLLSGNETGILLLDYICSQRVKHNQMPNDPIMVKTIVTMDMAEKIASHYGVKTINVLTGFKYIGEQIGLLEANNEANRYIFGFEESYGYLSGSYVRDKDAVDGAYLIAEMFAFYKTRNISLLDKLNELYATYGYYLNTLHSYEFEGLAGFKKMQSILDNVRLGIDQLGNYKVVEVKDYALGIDGLPKSDVLVYRLENDATLILRPSGTEPKMKVYISVCASDKAQASIIEQELTKAIEHYLQ